MTEQYPWYDFDLVKGREKVSEVLMAAVWKQSELSGHLATIQGLEDARRGNLPGVHLLATSTEQCQKSSLAGADVIWLQSIPATALLTPEVRR